MPDFDAVLFAFGLTLFAGLSTGVGSLIALMAKESNTRFLSFALGFSAGVMLYVSFVEIMVKARVSLVAHWGEPWGHWATVLSFFGGIGLIAIIDTMIPSASNPHDVPSTKLIETVQHDAQEFAGDPDEPEHAITPSASTAIDRERLKRTGMFTAIAIAIHNFPEGLATFMAALSEPSLGVAIAVAVAIHNIPEGIAVAVPIFYATGSKKKAFVHSFLSGLAEPVGALVGYLILMPFFSPATFGVIFAGVAGIMVFISLDELLPTAEEYGEHHLCIYGAVLGMAVMALSLLLLL